MTACTPLPTTAAPMAAVTIAVADQSNARPCLPNLLDERLVPLAIEHDDDQVLHVAVEAPGDLLEVVGYRRVEIHRVLRLRADHQLLHVDVRRVQQPTPFGRRQHRNGPRGPGGAQVRALQGIDGDVDFGQLLLLSVRTAARRARRCTASAPCRAPLLQSPPGRRWGRDRDGRASPRPRPGRKDGDRRCPIVCAQAIAACSTTSRNPEARSLARGGHACTASR